MNTSLHEQVDIPAYLPKLSNDWVLCQNIEKGMEEHKSGLLVPVSSSFEDIAAVLAVGPGGMLSNGTREPMLFKPGDIVRTTRKKGREAMIETQASGGERKATYNLYRTSELMMVEYHSQGLAAKLAEVGPLEVEF